MSRQAHWGIGLLLLQPLGAWALGLGEIELNSALNQPLNAEIRLISASPEEVDTLKVQLASRDTFQRYGLDRPSYLGDLTFLPGKDSRGRDVIKVQTLQSLTEPFVTMLVEATWPRGRLLKEYTILLDPPVLLPQPQATPNVQAPSSNNALPGQTAGRIQRPANQPAPSASMPAPAATSSRSFSSGDGGTYGPVQRNETLWRIAEQVRPDDRITMNQMMVALYQANPGAFDGNINRLRRGAVLQVPAGADIGGITTRDANAQVSSHNQAWRGGSGVAQPRLVLSAPDDSGATGGQRTGASGGDDSALRSEVLTLKDELAERDRLLSIQDQQLKDLQEQLASMQNDPAAIDKPLVDMADDPDPVADDDPIATDPGGELTDDGELFADDPAIDVTPDEVTAPVVPSVTSVVTQPESKGLLATILEWVLKPMVWIGAGALFLLAGGLWFLRRRQESATDITGRWEALEAETEDDGDDAHEATARMRAKSDPDNFLVEEAVRSDQTLPGIDPTTVEAALEDTPALFGDETLSSQTAINLDHADPVAEADFHMAYGLYDQAADLLEKAVNDEPKRRDLKLKLLEVFFVWDNKDSFRSTAQALRTEMGANADSDWDKISIMGKQICPNDKLFSDAVAGAAVDLNLDAGGDAPLDFSLEDSSAGALDLDFGDELADSGATAATMALGAVDIGEQTAAGLEAAFVLDGDDTASRTSPDLGGLAETMESPTLESPGMGDETVEMPDASPTVESPTVEIATDSPTMESPTLESPMAELPTVEQPILYASDQTAEIDLNDLGLDLDGLDALPNDTQNREALSDLDPDDDLLSATGVTQVLEGDIFEQANTAVLSEDDATMMAPAFDEGTMARTTVMPQSDDLDPTNQVEVLMVDDAPDPGATSEFRRPSDDDLDLNLDDLSAAMDGAETVEQPGPGGSFPNAIFDADGDLDLDIGSSLSGSDDPTATEQVGIMDPQTLTEVGTKLDLARAYIDMGDPEGARSILDEVVKEGDPSQRQEAQGLISGLGA